MSCEADAQPDIDSMPWEQRQTDFKSAWEFTDKGAGVRIAVIDTGFDVRHQQLNGTTSEEVPGQSIIGGAVDTIPFWEDCEGHGTQVASIIAGQRVQGTAFIGVAPNATLIPIRVKHEADSNVLNGDIAAGILYAIEQRAHIINVSLETFDDDEDLEFAVAAAEEAGILIVAAAGNRGSRAAYPAKYSEDYSNVISVGAIAEDGTFMGEGNPNSEFVSGSASNAGVAGPGVGVTAATGQSGHTRVDGTSFAAPFVSGVAALVLNAFPDLTPAEVKLRLEKTAHHPGYDLPHKHLGWGPVNPVAAVTAVLPPEDAAQTERPAPPKQVVAPLEGVEEDNTRRNVALYTAAGAALVSLITLAVATVYRRGRERNWQPGTVR